MSAGPVIANRDSTHMPSPIGKPCRHAALAPRRLALGVRRPTIAPDSSASSQRFRGIHPGRTSRRQVTGEQRDAEKRRWRNNKGRQIARLDLVQQARHQPGQQQRGA